MQGTWTPGEDHCWARGGEAHRTEAAIVNTNFGGNLWAGRTVAERNVAARHSAYLCVRCNLKKKINSKKYGYLSFFRKPGTE